MSATQVIQTIKKDMLFYRKSSGGVTFSGGEFLTQPDFLKELIEGCQELGIHTAVETCGYFSWEKAKDTVGMLDLVMFDLKHMDARRHKELTGASNKMILENAKKIDGLGIPMVVRIPIIPSINDSSGNIRAMAEFVRNQLSDDIGIELLPYHKLGLAKYSALGLDYKLDYIAPPDDAHMEMLRDLITDVGVPCITADSGDELVAIQAGRRSVA